MRLAVNPLQLQRFLPLSFHALIFLSKAESFGLFQTGHVASVVHGDEGFASFFFNVQTLKLIKLTGLIGGAVQIGIWGGVRASIGKGTRQTGWQQFLHAYVKHASDCQSHRNVQGQVQSSLVMLLFQHLLRPTEKKTQKKTRGHFLHFLSGQPQSGSGVRGHRTKTLPVNCVKKGLNQTVIQFEAMQAPSQLALWQKV